MKSTCLLLSIFLLSSSSWARQIACVDDAPIDANALYKEKFDNFMNCYNSYAKSLGNYNANSFCEKLSKKENFEKMDFASKSFKSCVNYFSITAPQNSVAAMVDLKDKNLEIALDKCADFHKESDFSARSYTVCFNVYGGNLHPVGNEEAKKSLEAAFTCKDQTQKYDFTSAQFSDCWDKLRRMSGSRPEIVESCLKEAP